MWYLTLLLISLVAIQAYNEGLKKREESKLTELRIKYKLTLFEFDQTLKRKIKRVHIQFKTLRIQTDISFNLTSEKDTKF
ncbi:hypothetical protein [Psychroserpens damuponensis]|uniref:hypothetical protein n=1 Tax=Psychroserpens damuponensis TaxID=943936 RepID=UPI000590140B|nr:hypothetical protein [Psychroserpens damuponensis]